MATKKTVQTALSVEVVKQYTGLITVQRRVVVKVPGKFFPQLQPSEQKDFYEGEAVEHHERHTFARHAKAWGAAHTGPGIRIICKSDAIDDPDYKGFWTTLPLFNRWRHDTYKENPDAELQFLDKLPAREAPATAAPAATREAPPINV